MSGITIATRREFLNRGLGLVGVGAALPNFLIRSALAGPRAEPDQRVLVVLQLDGGNDSISTLVPHGNRLHYEYRKEATRIPEKDVLKINEELGLHPNLRGWKQLLDEGLMAAVQGIGYPNPNFSHFTATDTWLMGDPRGRQVPYGWVGRACDAGFPGNPDAKLAVAVGNSFGAGLPSNSCPSAAPTVTSGLDSARRRGSCIEIVSAAGSRKGNSWSAASNPMPRSKSLRWKSHRGLDASRQGRPTVPTIIRDLLHFSNCVYS